MKTSNFNELIGSHQHGFRKFHSTTTCAMELRDSISKYLDNKEKVLVYSLDLSAAFDMLRMDTFHDMLKEDIPEDLMGFFMDFLNERRFLVSVEGIDSGVVHIDRGCPQGSVLGPILFSMYVRKAMQKLPERCKYQSYADDSYVVIHERSIEGAKQVLEEVIVSHISELTKIGMVVNKTKTEIVHFRNPRDTQAVESVEVSGVEVATIDSMKVLGILFDSSLTWKLHIDQLCRKLPPLLNGIKIIRRQMNFKQSLMITTAQALSILYYGASVWLTPSLTKSQLRRVERLHYKSVRLVVKDYRRKMSRPDIDKKTGRLPPSLWAKFSLSKLFINMRINQHLRQLLADSSKNLYVKSRQPGLLFGYDDSNTKIGGQQTCNWIGKCLENIVEPWTDKFLSDDSIRVLLKRAFKSDDYKFLEEY